MMDMFKDYNPFRTCKTCGWVHFAINRKHAEKEVESFNQYFLRLPVRKRKQYYNNTESNIKYYEQCYLCGGSYRNFRPSKLRDCPDGVTVSPIIHESSTYKKKSKGKE